MQFYFNHANHLNAELQNLIAKNIPVGAKFFINL